MFIYIVTNNFYFVSKISEIIVWSWIWTRDLLYAKKYKKS